MLMNSSSSMPGGVEQCRNGQKVHLGRRHGCPGSRETCKHWYFCEDKDFVFTQSTSLRLFLISSLSFPSEAISDSPLYNLKDTGIYVKGNSLHEALNVFPTASYWSQQVGLFGSLKPRPKKITSLTWNIWQKYSFSCRKCLSRFLGLIFRIKQL